MVKEPELKNGDPNRLDAPNPRLIPIGSEATHAAPRIVKKTLPDDRGTLCALPLAVEVDGPDKLDPALLWLPFDLEDAAGIDLTTIRVFRWQAKEQTYAPVWNSGVNRQLGFIWAKIERPGVYVPIGLPRDRLLYAALERIAVERRYVEGDDPEAHATLSARYLRTFTELSAEALAELREALARVELETTAEPPDPRELRRKTGGHILHFALPGDLTAEEFKKRTVALRFGSRGLPEEALFYPPEDAAGSVPPWQGARRKVPWQGIPDASRLKVWKHFDFIDWFPWFFSADWWMYQHDEEHSGAASGLSGIRSTNVHKLFQLWKTPVTGEMLTKPAIVGGKVYIGTSTYSGTDTATLFKINLYTGVVEGSFTVTGTAFYSVAGVGGTPAVTGGRIYFTTVYGQVYCLDAATMTQVWMTNLKNANLLQNQPINNYGGDSWSGPVVANGKLWIGSGEGESSSPFGFVWCLDAGTGHVKWVFCTNKFVDPDNPGSENQPNHLPTSTAASWAAAAGFTVRPDPPHKGASVWSSCAYDKGLDRIYVCTGNSRPDNPLPDERYASGIISLDATSGAFKGFFQPQPSDAYHPGEFDVDVPCGPTLYTAGGKRVVAFGSKNGSFFVLDADTLAVHARRQLLARVGGSGLPGDYGTADVGTGGVVPLSAGGGENKWGVMGTAGLHYGLKRVFVGLGGYSGVSGYTKTPFLRALHWDTLQDAWPTAVGPDNISRYTTTTPPMYLRDEAGLASPAVVNDVVFMSTHKTALYALDANTGHCLWSAPGLPAGGWPTYALGPAVSGNYVVMGTDHDIYCWKLRSRIWWIEPPDWIREWPPWRWPLPDPPPWPWPEPWPVPRPGPGPDPPPPWPVGLPGRPAGRARRLTEERAKAKQRAAGKGPKKGTPGKTRRRH